MKNSVIACLFHFVFGAVLFVVNATAPFFLLPHYAEYRFRFSMPCNAGAE